MDNETMDAKSKVTFDFDFIRNIATVAKDFTDFSNQLVYACFLSKITDDQQLEDAKKAFDNFFAYIDRT